MLRCDDTCKLTVLPLATYFGAEGEGSGSANNAGDTGTTATGGASTGGAATDQTQQAQTQQAQADPKSFSEDYVKDLRGESAKYRTRAKEAEEELAKLKAAEEERAKAEMSDLEKAQTERGQFQTRAEQAESNLKVANTRLQVVIEAGKLNFLDPGDAMALLDLSEVEFDKSGNPDAKEIKKQLTAIAKEKPYLLKDGKAPDPGSGDGGPNNPGAPTDKFQTSVDQYSKELANQGMIPIPQ